jgi:hypothetical protein
MDMSRIKNAFSGLVFIRNYSAYILPVVLTVVALGLMGVSSLISKGLRGKVEGGSVELGNSVKALGLQGISARQWQVEKQYQDTLDADANGMSRLLRQTTQRELLSYKLFPEPKDTSILIFEQFGQKYRSSIEELIVNYGARGCPTSAEIEKAVLQTRSEGSGLTDASGGYRGLGGDMRGSSFSIGGMDKVERMIIDELCHVAARKASFYASPLDIAGYEYWGKSPAGEGMSKIPVFTYRSIQQSVEACWYWQLGYWIIEDVFETIGAMNSSCDNVMGCPVKRLMRINFGLGADDSAGMSAPPSYVRTLDEGLTLGHTGRVCDEQMDIVQFELLVLVDSRFVLPFMDELCSAKEHTFKGWSGDGPVQQFKHNQITVLEVNVDPVNLDTGSGTFSGKGHQLYRYGDEAVVEMKLICEYIFERAGYDEIKPELIENPSAEEQY